MQVHVMSDIGLVREANEDNYLCEPPHLFVVADGMGGHVAGEIASKLAVATISSYISEHAKDNNPDELLMQAIGKANGEIYQLAQSQGEYSGMGTTVTAVYIENSDIYWGHVGDSRLYLLRDNSLQQITDDHSMVWEMLQAGNITQEEALNHPWRNMLTRAVGTSRLIRIDTGILKFQPGDVLLLCTDGLTNMVDKAEITRRLSCQPLEVTAAVEELVASAKQAGGTDNITAIVLKNGDA